MLMCWRGAHLTHASGAQMKEKYTKMRPYGEWLAEQTVILQQIIDAVPAEQRRAPPVLPASALHVSARAMLASAQTFVGTQSASGCA